MENNFAVNVLLANLEQQEKLLEARKKIKIDYIKPSNNKINGDFCQEIRNNIQEIVSALQILGVEITQKEKQIINFNDSGDVVGKKPLKI